MHGLVHTKAEKMGKLLNCIICSVKRRCVSNDVEIELCIRCQLTFIHVETMWSSTFDMIRK